MQYGCIAGRGKAGSNVPNVFMPASIAKVDRAIRVMPQDLFSFIEKSYVQSIKVNKRKLTEALLWLSGRLA